MKKLFFAVVLFACCWCFAQEYRLEVKSDRHWNLKINEKVHFTARLLYRKNSGEKFQELTGRKLLCVVNNDGLKVSEKTLLSGKNCGIVSSLPHPGWINVKFTLLDDSGKKFEYKDKKGTKKQVSASIGALVEPEKLKPGTKKPDDFDAFWDEQRRILDKVPMKAQLTEVEPSSRQKGKFHCYDVQITCAGDMPVSGYLCVPRNAKPKSLPAVVSFHGAGVRSSYKSISLTPALYFDVNSHGIPNGKPKKYYDSLSKKELYAYWYRNANDREKYYFRGIFFRAMRALDYIKSRPEWNGKVLIVTGSSMGGAQSLGAAALDPQVSHCVVAVPALMDHYGSLAEIPRAPGWPRFFDVRRRKADPGRFKTAAYYDNVFMADRIKCKVYLTAGLDDGVCVPTSIYVLYNQLPEKNRSIEIYPTGKHSTSHSKVKIFQLLK